MITVWLVWLRVTHGQWARLFYKWAYSEVISLSTGSKQLSSPDGSVFGDNIALLDVMRCLSESVGLRVVKYSWVAYSPYSLVGPFSFFIDQRPVLLAAYVYLEKLSIQYRAASDGTQTDLIVTHEWSHLSRRFDTWYKVSKYRCKFCPMSLSNLFDSVNYRSVVWALRWSGR